VTVFSRRTEYRARISQKPEKEQIHSDIISAIGIARMDSFRGL
jgi:hypothetical protein